MLQKFLTQFTKENLGSQFKQPHFLLCGTGIIILFIAWLLTNVWLAFAAGIVITLAVMYTRWENGPK